MTKQERSIKQSWVGLTLAALFIGAALLTPVRALVPGDSQAAAPHSDTIGPVAEEHVPDFG